jgi:hypothetical protein
MPDMVSLGFSNAATFISQNSIIALDDYTDQITDFDSIDENLLVGMRKIGNGKLLNPLRLQTGSRWYNTQRFAELGVSGPSHDADRIPRVLQEIRRSRFVQVFLSLRGVRPYDSLVAWLWTYTEVSAMRELVRRKR